MPDDHPTDHLDEDEEDTSWDSLEVMRERARATRTDRNEAISTLRESMSDDEIKNDFGIDLREIEG